MLGTQCVNHLIRDSQSGLQIGKQPQADAFYGWVYSYQPTHERIRACTAHVPTMMVCALNYLLDS